MRLNQYFSALILVLILFSGCSGNENDSLPETETPTNPTSEEPTPPTPPNTLTTEERLQKIINDKVGDDTDKLVGVSVSIRVGTEERWKLVGGISKLGEPVTSDMRFGLASITKTAVAATVMKLVDEGVLSLEDTIDDWVAINSPNVDQSITIFQLLSHFTGVNGYFTEALWTQVEGDLNTALEPIEVTDYILEPTNVPGVTHEYSNSNYLILGLIIEAATQKTVGEVMREKFWTPLALNSTYFGANESIDGPIATPWRDNDGDGTLEDIADEFGAGYHSIFYCAADVFSTASDLSMWAQHLYNGDAISLDSRQKMMTSYFDIPDPVFTGYGLGVRRNVYAGRIMWGHTGGMRGYGTAMFFEPLTQVSIAMLNNQSRSADGPLLRYELVEELLAVVYEDLLGQ
jgi:D-alanyl-D-alanine carboxypeptidase